MGQNERMGTHRVLGSQAPNGVVLGFPRAELVDRPVFVEGGVGCLNVILIVVRVIDIEIKAERLFTTERHYVVEVRILLLGDVFVVSVVQRCAQVLVECICAADNVDALQADVVAARRRHGAVGSEAAGVQFQAFDFVAGDQRAGKRLGQQAGVVVREHGHHRHLIAVFEDGVGYLELDGCAGLRQVALGVAIGVALEHGAIVVTTTAIQAYAQDAVGIYADADGALSEAGFERGDEALAPAAYVVSAVLVIAVVVGIAQQQVQARVFHEPLGLRLLAGQCHLGGARRYGQGDYAPLHHFHCDCSFGLNLVLARPR